MSLLKKVGGQRVSEPFSRTLPLIPGRKRTLEQQFNTNHDLCKLTEDVIFTFPYMQHDSNQIFSGMEEEAKKLRDNTVFKNKMLDLKYIFMNQRDALLHADLHTGSIMANEDETFIIDPEFAFFGPFGFDVGALTANLLFSYVAHRVSDTTSTYADWVLNTLFEFLTKFEEKFLNLWRQQTESALVTDGFLPEKEIEHYRQTAMRRIFQQSMGFAGCKMARRIFGIAGVADLRDIPDATTRIQAEKMALSMAIQLVERYEEISDIAALKTLVM